MLDNFLKGIIITVGIWKKSLRVRSY